LRSCSTRTLSLLDKNSATAAGRGCPIGGHARRVGRYDYLTKPVDPQRLKILLDKAVERHETLREVLALRRQLHDQGGPKPPSSLLLTPGMTLDEAERRLIEITLEHTGNNKTRAAEILGISVKTLHNKLNRFKLEDATACATKGYVKTRVDDVNAEVESVERSVEETQAQARKNASRIDEVDRTANSAMQSAEAAGAAAQSAGAAAGQANDRVAAIETSARRLLFEVVISEDHGQFAFNKAELPDPAKAKIDELVERLKTYDKGVSVEIEGHTDTTGPKEINERIGLERAEAVKRYLPRAARAAPAQDERDQLRRRQAGGAQ
jgi:outer membrane protein OmpA-like peptidoglycan-associated protein